MGRGALWRPQGTEKSPGPDSEEPQPQRTHRKV